MPGIEVLSFTVGPVAENAYLIWKEGSDKALMIDPGDEPDRLMAPLAERDLGLEAILLTHCHFDHIGAVAPVARATRSTALNSRYRYSPMSWHMCPGPASVLTRASMPTT